MRLLCGEGLYKTWGTAKMCENKNLSYFMYLSGVGMGRVKMGGDEKETLALCGFI